MSASSHDSDRLRRAAPRFASTHWSVVLAAADPRSARARAALETLCSTYWYPLYAFVRRSGHPPHDAEDLVQEFFLVCLDKGFLESADRQKGRFRSFLLVALKRFLANQWDKARARKRGGDRRLISLDGLTAEERYRCEPADTMSADKLYDRRWALTLLERVLERLGEEQAKAGRHRSFELLREFLATHQRSTPYAQLAQRLDTNEGALKVAVHRLRQRYRRLLEEEISQTVSDPAEVPAERRHLLAALGG